MSWRTIIIDDALKLKLVLDNMIIKTETDEVSVNLNEIKNIILTDHKTTITVRLLQQIAHKGIDLVICDDSKMPKGNYLPLTNNSRTTKYRKISYEYLKENKEELWQKIIRSKIYNQMLNLKLIGEDYNAIYKYYNNVKLYDRDNQEGIAARCYFVRFFGEDFKRFDDDLINACLDYTYQIIRSRISQQLLAKGLDPCIGIFHRSEYNSFCLSDDLIEPYRPIIDWYIREVLREDDYKYLSAKLKFRLTDIVNYQITFNGKKHTVDTSISPYIDCALNNEIEYQFPKLDVQVRLP